MAIWLDGGTRLHLIPGLDSTTNAHVYAINDLGEVTGTGWVRGSTPGFVAYRYSMSGGLEILRPLVQDPLATDFLSARSSAGVAINNAGVVVGWASDSTGVQPVLWRRNNLPVPLGRMPGASRTFVVAINDAGTAVGYELQDGVNTSRPIVWRAVGSPELLPMPFGVTSAWAAAIDGRGRIYGASRSGPIVWLEDGTFAELPLFPMFTQPQPLGVSPCGKVAAMADRWVVWDRIC